MRTTALRPIRALLVLALLVGAGWILYISSGADGSRTVPLGSLAELHQWADDTQTPVMAMAVARLAGLFAFAYLSGAVAIALVADALRCKVLARAALAATPAAFRRLLGVGVARAGLVAGTILAPALAATTASATPAEEPEQPTATMTRVETDPPAVATMVRLEPEAPVPTPHPPPPPAAAVAAPAAAADDTWVVEPGDSFWSIAEEAVGSADEVSGYWQALITANRNRLVAPDCPDLLIPGQTLVLPAT